MRRLRARVARAVAHGSPHSSASPRTTWRLLNEWLCIGVLALSAPRSVCAADGVPIGAALHDQTGTVATPDGSGGAYVAWLDARLGYNIDVVLTRIDGSLKRPNGWVADGNHVTLITCQKADIAMAADGNGAWLAWADNRCAAGAGFDIYAMRMGADGLPAPGMPANGVALDTRSGDQLHTAIAPDGAGGAFVAWTDQSYAPNRLLCTHVLASGAVDSRWPSGGLVLSATVPDSAHASLLADGGSGVFIAWQDVRSGDADIVATHLGADGAPLGGWPLAGSPFAHASGARWAPQLISDGAGGVIAAWLDTRDAITRVYAKRFDASGAAFAGWGATGRAVAPASGAQSGATLVSDGANGAFVAWLDTRDADGPIVYAQRLDGAGAAFLGWPATGTRACSAAGPESAPQMLRAAQGGVMLAWFDARRHANGTTDLYAQRLASNGAVSSGWASSGALVCDIAGDRSDLALASDGAGGAFAAWSDARAPQPQGRDIAAARVRASGPGESRAGNLFALHHDGQTFLQWRAPLGLGWTYRVYASASPIADSASLASATLLGSVGDSSACDHRLSAGMGTVYGSVIDASGFALDPASGLFVHTPATNGAEYYAVTVQNGVFAENRTIVPGANALVNAVNEVAATPLPVHQRDLTVANVHAEIWSLWASDHDTPFVRALANVEGLQFDCGVVPAIDTQYGTSLMMPLHYRGGSFLDGLFGTGTPGEHVLGLDDGLPNGLQTFWYGYATTVDVRGPLAAPPVSGVVIDYTLRRAAYTIDWALAHYGIDPGRVYTYGYSMGGAGAVNFALHLGSRIAGAISAVGKTDFSFASDPDTACFFAPNGYLRQETDRIWGTIATNLPASEGGRIYERLSGPWLAADAATAMTPLFVFSGKRDTTMGWAENVGFYAAMEAAKRGGAFYWEDAPHNSTVIPEWQPMRNPRQLYQFRTDRSFPAPSHCTIDDDPGDGHFDSGAPIGTIHGYFAWDSVVTETQTLWQTGMRLRTLTLNTTTWTPPDSAIMDITPRRTQAFHPAPGTPVQWTLRRLPDSLRVAAGQVLTADDGSVTVPALHILRAGVVLRLTTGPTADVDDTPHGLRPGIAFATNPAHARTACTVTWPHPGEGHVTLHDVTGRRVREWNVGAVGENPTRLTLGDAALTPGLYFVRARVGHDVLVGRLVLLR